MKLSSTKRCLFGAPSLEDVENMVDEHMRADRKRFRDNYGIDIDDLENSGIEVGKLHVFVRRKCESPRKKLRFQDVVESRIVSVLKPCNRRRKLSGNNFA